MDDNAYSQLFIPQLHRAQWIIQCATLVSTSSESFNTSTSSSTSTATSTNIWDDSTTSQSNAIDWFITGSGRYMNFNFPSIKTNTAGSSIVSINDCPFDFVQAYTILVIRFSLNIQDPSWYNNHTTTGSTSNNKSNYITSLQDICHWTRIGCSTTTNNINSINNNQYYIKSLSFKNSNIVGTVPTELWNGYGLPLVQKIDLYSNIQLSGTIPNSIYLLNNTLQILQLHNTSMYGTIPNTFLRLTNLHTIHLEHTLLTGNITTTSNNDNNINTTFCKFIHIPCTVTCNCCYQPCTSTTTTVSTIVPLQIPELNITTT